MKRNINSILITFVSLSICFLSMETKWGRWSTFRHLSMGMWIRPRISIYSLRLMIYRVFIPAKSANLSIKWLIYS